MMTEHGQRSDLPAHPGRDDAAAIRRSRDEPEHFAVLFRQRHRYDLGRMNARPWLYA
jgi:hypothetical protein